jgi:hypothetical protein
LLATPEALIAVTATRGCILALGYFNHVVYQYDCRHGTSRSVTVGSWGGHISRNFFSDTHGHVYVPRLKQAPAHMVTTIVELDAQLREQVETPIAYYTQTRDDDSHGIVGFQPLADCSIVFVTDQGYLYQVIPQEGGAAAVRDLGWFHPRGQAYVASLFTSDGRRHLMGLAVSTQTTQLEWLVYEMTTRAKAAVSVPLPNLAGQQVEEPYVYGSVTRDNAGRCYVVGTARVQGRAYPLFLQVQRLG